MLIQTICNLARDLDLETFLKQATTDQSFMEIADTGLYQNLFQVFSEYYIIINKLNKSIIYSYFIIKIRSYQSG